MLKNRVLYFCIVVGTCIFFSFHFAGTAIAATPGDANNDGRVDGLDYVIWLNNYNSQTPDGPSRGDFNGDRVVDGIDYVVWLQNYERQSGINITDVTDNRTNYSGSKIPRYNKFEATFQIRSTSSQNTFFPYDINPPAGIPPKTGITVNAIFTDPNGATFVQPAFIYQEFEDRVIDTKEWFYPKNSFVWKVRFSPHLTGLWNWRIEAQDASGLAQVAGSNFEVTSSGSHGFIKVSANDTRYFEYDDGTYFPALGFNLNGGDLDNVNPVLGNTSEFSNMGPNGIQLSRIWVTQFSIYGEGWGKWGDHNPAHFTHQEPRLGIVNPLNWQFASWYPSLTPPSPPTGSEYYLWLDYDTYQDTNPSAHNLYPRFTPCRYFANVALKQNTSYRVRVRYKAYDIEGPKVSGNPFGFAVKKDANGLYNNEETIDEIGKCNDPTKGTVIAATYNSGAVTPDPINPGWLMLEETFANTTDDFLGYLYLTFNNVTDKTEDNKAGHVFIDRIWLEEASCTNSCANLIHKPWMSMHEYINQRDAYAFDKVLALAEQFGIYLKAVMMEKNDRIFTTIGFNGEPLSTQDNMYFYGDNRNVTKVRWLHQAWWRYMQARWGYSTNIHSWELLNEGDPGSTRHHILTDEFGKYMKCKVFGKVDQIVNDPVAGNICKYDHPNAHPVSTSFWGSNFPWRFWNNSDKAYADVDYADQHMYADEPFSDPAEFYDSAYFSYRLSMLPNLFGPGKRKPFIRGEAGWGFSLPRTSANNPFSQNQEGGEWLHDYIWAGINPGGLMEQYFAGGYFTDHIYNIPKIGPAFDHRPMFKTYFNFIKNIPLNNGTYQDASASASTSNIRVWGQKDVTNKRAHLWIANKNHTWYNVMDGYSGGPLATHIGPVTGTISLTGFSPNTTLPIVWWNTYTGQPDATLGNPVTNITTDANGTLILSVANLVSDTAVKIGTYPN